MTIEHICSYRTRLLSIIEKWNNEFIRGKKFRLFIVCCCCCWWWWVWGRWEVWLEWGKAALTIAASKIAGSQNDESLRLEILAEAEFIWFWCWIWCGLKDADWLWCPLFDWCCCAAAAAINANNACCSFIWFWDDWAGFCCCCCCTCSCSNCCSSPRIFATFPCCDIFFTRSLNKKKH